MHTLASSELHFVANWNSTLLLQFCELFCTLRWVAKSRKIHFFSTLFSTTFSCVWQMAACAVVAFLVLCSFFSSWRKFLQVEYYTSCAAQERHIIMVPNLDIYYAECSGHVSKVKGRSLCLLLKEEGSTLPWRIFFCTCTLLGDGDAWYYNTRQYNSGDWAIQYIRDFKPIFAVKKNIYESYSRWNQVRTHTRFSGANTLVLDLGFKSENRKNK